MKKNLVFAAAAVLVSALSCGPVKYSSSDSFDVKGIDEFAFIEPVADILYYNEKNRPVYDVDLSDDAADLIETIISSQRYPFSKPISMDYDGDDRDIRKWIQNFGGVSTNRLSRVRVPSSVSQAILASGHRYGVLIYSSGYIRSREAIRYEERQEAIGDIISIAIDAIANSTKKNKDEKTTSSSRPSDYNSQNKTPYDSKLYCVVIDAQEEEVAHYIHTVPLFEKDPLNSSVMETMLSRLLKEFM